MTEPKQHWNTAEPTSTSIVRFMTKRSALPPIAMSSIWGLDLMIWAPIVSSSSVLRAWQFGTHEISFLACFYSAQTFLGKCPNFSTPSMSTKISCNIGFFFFLKPWCKLPFINPWLVHYACFKSCWDVNDTDFYCRLKKHPATIGSRLQWQPLNTVVEL